MSTPCSEGVVRMEKEVFVIALHEGGQFIQEMYETVAFARELCGGKPRIVVLAGDREIAGLADALARDTGLDVTGLSGRSLKHYSAEAYTKHVSAFFHNRGPVTLCIPHTAQGGDFAPQLSVCLDACCITAVERIEAGALVRSVFGGKFKAYHRPSAPSAVLTVLPGAWKRQVAVGDSPGRLTIVPVADDTLATTVHGIRESAHANTALSEAEVVVSAGRGVGKPEHVSNIKALCALFSKSAIGASRAVCDLGWLDYSHQIGSTGNRVSPRLYIACGISGAIQHIAGMKDSRTVIAINTDRRASIFGIARYCIVEDVNTFIPLIIDTYAKGRGKG